MGILSMVEQVRAVEHRKVRTALAAAWGAMRRFEESRQEAAEPARDLFGDPLNVSPEPKRGRQVNMRPLYQAWEPFEDTLLRRLDLWEQELWPLVRVWEGGAIVDESVREVSLHLAGQRQDVDHLLQSVRVASHRVGELRAPMLSLFSALQRAEVAENRVMPALLAGDPVSVDTLDRGRTPADVVRALRTKLQPPPAPEPEPEPTALGRFMGWLGGGR